jgi:hypothetical protein
LEAQLVVAPGVQDTAHALPLQARWLGHCAVVTPDAQLPLPSHCVSVVSVVPLHESFAHAVPAAANVQAPVPGAQAPVSPQGGFVTAQLVVQQMPLVPHVPLVHWSAAEQVAPGTTLGTQWLLESQ